MRDTYLPYIQFCRKLREQHLLRYLPRNHVFPYDFSHNDYLGFSQHPVLIQKAIKAADEYGVGAKASRLISTQQKQAQALENEIAKCKQSQSALIFNSGFQANISVLSAILDPKVLGTKPLVFSDRLNHASMHAACKLVNTQQQRFYHADYDHLKYLLNYHSSNQPKFILTESVFGMDGDIADLSQLVKIAKDYNAMLYVDEAHATGLFGSKGYGLTADFANAIDITMGTFSKALGGSGAYIACSNLMKRYLINRCQGFIYSTAPSPLQIAAMHAAWQLIPSHQTQVQTLFKQAQSLRMALKEMGLNTGASTTHIIPIILHFPTQTLAAQRFLAKRGVRVSAIRPPSVSPNQSRLRIALNVTHSAKAIDELKKGLKDFVQNGEIIF